MRLAETLAAIAGTASPAGYTLSHRLDADGVEHVLHVDGPNGWYAEIMHIRQVAWLRKSITLNNQGQANTDSAI